jgi:hypothetical protein
MPGRAEELLVVICGKKDKQEDKQIAWCRRVDVRQREIVSKYRRLPDNDCVA